MKKVINFATAGLFAVAVLFTACRESTSTENTTETTVPTTEAPVATPQVDTTQTAMPADTTKAPQ